MFTDRQTDTHTHSQTEIQQGKNENEKEMHQTLTIVLQTSTCSIRGPVVDQKYACSINFPIRHAPEHVMLNTIFELEPSA